MKRFFLSRYRMLSNYVKYCIGFETRAELNKTVIPFRSSTFHIQYKFEI